MPVSVLLPKFDAVAQLGHRYFARTGKGNIHRKTVNVYRKSTFQSVMCGVTLYTEQQRAFQGAGRVQRRNVDLYRHHYGTARFHPGTVRGYTPGERFAVQRQAAGNVFNVNGHVVGVHDPQPNHDGIFQQSDLFELNIG